MLLNVQIGFVYFFVKTILFKFCVLLKITQCYKYHGVALYLILYDAVILQNLKTKAVRT